MITKRQALDEMKRIKQERSPLPQSELAYSQLEKVVNYYDAIAAISDDMGWRKPQTMEWYTPPVYIEMAREVMGCIDLDPASNKIAQKWIQAKCYYTKEDDGLNQKWFGNVWINPPYGIKYPKLFLKKAIESHESGEIQQAIVLLNRTGAAWYRELLGHCSAICEVKKRIAFLSPEEVQEKSPRYYNDFLYLGDRVAEFKKVFGVIGNVAVYKKSCTE